MSFLAEFWKFLKEGTSQDFNDEAIDIMRLIGPTPSVGGQIPKLLVAIPDRDSWDGSRVRRHECWNKTRRDERFRQSRSSCACKR